MKYTRTLFLEEKWSVRERAVIKFGKCLNFQWLGWINYQVARAVVKTRETSYTVAAAEYRFAEVMNECPQDLPAILKDVRDRVKDILHQCSGNNCYIIISDLDEW